MVRFQEEVTFDFVMQIIAEKFVSLKIHLENCVKIRRDFWEAYRGYLIGYKAGQGIPDRFGRHPIKCFDDGMNNEGPSNEITFEFQGAILYGEISKTALNVSTFQLIPWTEEFKSYISELSIVTQIEITEKDFEGEFNLFYTDLARRLEEGDFEGGERKSRYRTIDSEINF